MKPRQVSEIVTVFRRKTEPKSLVMTRIGVTLFFFFILVGYMYIQIVDVRLDVPVFATIQSREEKETIPMPILHFTYRYQFTMTCRVAGPSGRATNLTPEECLTHLQQPELSSRSNYEGFYEGSFKANELNFIRNEIEKLEIIIYTVNPSEIPPDDLGVEIRIFDSQVQNPLDIDMNNYKKKDSDHLISLIDLNLYHLNSNQYHTIGLTRIRRDVIVEKWCNFLGIPPNYLDETYFNSVLENHPYTAYDNLTISYTKVALTMNSWRVPHEREQKARTLCDTFGQIAGVAGTLSIIYAFLFGAGPSAIQSWGVVQRMRIFGIQKGVKKHINRRYPKLPFVHKPDEGTSSSDISNDRDEIIERLDALERFLKEYVVDADFLEHLEEIEIEKGTFRNEINNADK